LAVTTTVNADWDRLTIGKSLSRQAALNSKIIEAVVCVSIGACMYPMCNAGYTVDLSLCGRISTIIEAIPRNLEVTGDELVVSDYVPAACDAAATGTLHFYESGGAVTTPLDEINACSCLAACSTIKFHVTGF